MSSTNTPTRLYGRWHTLVTRPGHDSIRATAIHVYTAPLPLPAPIHLGMRVRVLALVPAAIRVYMAQQPTMADPFTATHHNGRARGPTTYDVYDPRIEGAVCDVADAGAGRMAVAVANECAENSVRLVVLLFPAQKWTRRGTHIWHRPSDWLADVIHLASGGGQEMKGLRKDSSRENGPMTGVRAASGGLDFELEPTAVVLDQVPEPPTPAVAFQFPTPGPKRYGETVVFNVRR